MKTIRFKNIFSALVAVCLMSFSTQAFGINLSLYEYKQVDFASRILSEKLEKQGIFLTSRVAIFSHDSLTDIWYYLSNPIMSSFYSYKRSSHFVVFKVSFGLGSSYGAERYCKGLLTTLYASSYSSKINMVEQFEELHRQWQFPLERTTIQKDMVMFLQNQIECDNGDFKILLDPSLAE
jgi:hypothetical protein